MIRFGLISSLFDAATFAFLMIVTQAHAATFQTGWFVESLLTELAILLVIRTRRPAWRSRPSRLIAWLTAGVAILAVSDSVPAGFVMARLCAIADAGSLRADRHYDRLRPGLGMVEAAPLRERTKSHRIPTPRQTWPAKRGGPYRAFRL